MRSQKVTIVEVGPRDGLQNEEKILSPQEKIELINHLSETGLRRIEMTSFVHPKWIPQLADAVEVSKGIKRNPDVLYSALVPNRKGLERALEAGIDEAAIFMSASEGHNLKNINKTIDETYPVLEEVVKDAKQSGLRVRGYVSTAFGCPYDGKVDLQQVLGVTQRLIDMGVDEISIGDTIGVASPLQVERLLELLLKQIEAKQLALHFHDTRGTALANVAAALNMGISIFDSAVGGLGGCPYAKGASGNLATEDLVYMLEKMDADTGISWDRLISCGQYIQNKLGKRLPSKALQAAGS
jgi:hydroxymethylglutaryl-CoA lyase